MEAEIRLSNMNGDAIIHHCLICNDEIDEFHDGTKNILSDEVKTTYRQLPVRTALTVIINRQLADHSETICRYCYNYIDQIDRLERNLRHLKKALPKNYLNYFFLTMYQIHNMNFGHKG